MCLTTEALFLFLSLLPPDIVESSESRIIVRSEVRDAVWEPRDGMWCTRAPKIDSQLRLKQGEEV
ncbi:hypothetical protein [Tropicimonas isoalkanivorans]|uniref:Uncharacterized protein n=1 Tax=Tropicimonas isoalkanivorans TaxID=441112 RepID=A0A1I1LLF6_9RHOB|nr:hypothetical protein [Tropicimonas isoalkanivorans]SFC73392.1 hypothetical protein SAMN04488094_108164 [Tropicimonas isoalkanivorans]